MKRRIGIIVSPVIITASGFLTAWFFSMIMNDWALIPLSIVYWLLCLYYSNKYKGKSLKCLFSKPQGGIGWLITALVIGLLPVFIIIRNFSILNNSMVLATWLMFSLINPFIEEIYWRGVLTLSLPFKKRWVSITYSTLLFIVSKPLTWGVFSVAAWNPVILLPLACISILWSAIYIKTKSLWWCVISHFLIDFMGLTAAMLLNLYIP